ncbi:unnamed protein product [Linum trigynum]|uniref:Terpene synthase metal-binding domain-containing protein n=1 Tax=Linum trigynum TaxID=586398 RepID=A0AAV2EII9_9ROSI
MRILSTAAFVGLEPELATREGFEWATKECKMMKSGGVIGGLQNDIFSRKHEQKMGNVTSAVECYMKEYRASEEEAVEFLTKEVSIAWKDMAEEYCQKRTTTFPIAFADTMFNVARTVSFLYENADCIINSHLLKDHLTSLFIDPVPL